METVFMLVILLKGYPANESLKFETREKCMVARQAIGSSRVGIMGYLHCVEVLKAQRIKEVE